MEKDKPVFINQIYVEKDKVFMLSVKCVKENDGEVSCTYLAPTACIKDDYNHRKIYCNNDSGPVMMGYYIDAFDFATRVNELNKGK